MNALVNIDIGVKSTVRQWDEPFRPTRTYSQAFHFTTDLDSYLGAIHSYSVAIWNYVEAQRALLAEPMTHVAVRIGNPTHPTPAKGVIPLPKAHLDFAITDIDFAAITVLEDSLSEAIKNLRTQVKY